MAKANEKDMEAALAMCCALESLERGYLPDEMTEGQDGPVWYDERQHAASVVEFMIGIQNRASLFRICFGMTVVLDPRNEIVDPDLTHLELHPKFARVATQRGQLLAAIRNHKQVKGRYHTDQATLELYLVLDEVEAAA